MTSHLEQNCVLSYSLVIWLLSGGVLVVRLTSSILHVIYSSCETKLIYVVINVGVMKHNNDLLQTLTIDNFPRNLIMKHI